MHPLEQIRQALKTQLEEIPALQGRVYVERLRPFSSAQLPACAIFAREEVSLQKAAYWSDLRQVTFDIQLLAQGDESRLELDALRLLIEQRLTVTSELRAVCGSIEYLGARFEYEAEGECITGSAMLRYDIRYTFEPSVDESTLDDFLICHNTVRLDAPAPTAEDLIQLPQE